MITQVRLKDVLSYSPDTGEFIWKVSLSNRCKIGAIAGCRKNVNGYIRISVDGEAYYAHRLAWFYVYGVWPKEDIDHIDRDRLNNRIANLRECTRAENRQNVSIRSDNESGVTGVAWSKQRGKWLVQIACMGVQHYLGYFDDLDEAGRVYSEAKAKLHAFHPHSA